MEFIGVFNAVFDEMKPVFCAGFLFMFPFFMYGLISKVGGDYGQKHGGDRDAGALALTLTIIFVGLVVCLSISFASMVANLAQTIVWSR